MEGHGLEVPQMLRESVSFNSYFHILPRCLGLTLFGTQTFFICNLSFWEGHQTKVLKICIRLLKIKF